jgi:protein gp37
MGKTSIEWTDESWNPVTGCSKVSPGCANCYAESLTRRFASTWGVPDLPWTPENATANVILHPDRLDQPLRWKRPRMIFVNSMSDLFHELVPDTYIARVFRVMAQAPQHTFQVLTKRPERMRDLLSNLTWARLATGAPTPLSNVWLGTSIENRRFVGRADALRQTPAAVRFISAEPLLGPLVYDCDCGEVPWGHWRGDDAHEEMPELDLTGIDWLIVGGESGPEHRPMDPQWARDLRDACWEVDNGRGDAVAFFFKQWGGATPKAGGRELDGREWSEMPVTP